MTIGVSFSSPCGSAAGSTTPLFLSPPTLFLSLFSPKLYQQLLQRTNSHQNPPQPNHPAGINK